MKLIAIAVVSATVVGMSAPLLAQDDDRGIYVLGGAGQANMSIRQGDLDAASASVGNAVPSTTSNTGTGWKLGVGYQLNRYLGLEATYVDFGTLAYDNPSPGPTVGVDFRPKSWNLLGLATYPVTDSFGLFVKAGVAFTALSATVVENQTYRNSSDQTNLAWGLGAQYAFTHNWAVRAEYENFGKAGDAPNFSGNVGTGTGILGLASASVLFHF